MPLVDGTTWPSTWQSTRDGRQVSLPTVKAIAATDEMVIVPAGTFSRRIRLKITSKAQANLASGPSTIEVHGDEWYAPDIGFIKGVFRETVNSGEATAELGMDLANCQAALILGSPWSRPLEFNWTGRARPVA